MTCIGVGRGTGRPVIYLLMKSLRSAAALEEIFGLSSLLHGRLHGLNHRESLQGFRREVQYVPGLSHEVGPPEFPEIGLVS